MFKWLTYRRFYQKPNKKPSKVNFTKETIEILYDANELKDKLILEDESQLVKALKNQNIHSKIIFVGNRNSFVELLKRIRCNNGLSCNDNIGLASWINNFFSITERF